MLKSIIFLIVISTSLLYISCNDTNETPEGKTEKQAMREYNKMVKCLTGKWTHRENGETKFFVFNKDSSGYESMGETEENRNFKWKLEDNTPIITYEYGSQEWKMSLDCRKKELTVTGLTFKKSR